MTAPRLFPAPVARVGFGANLDWELALREAAAELDSVTPELIFAFSGSAFVADMPAIAEAVWRRFQAPIVIGATGRGVIAQHREYEHESTLSLMGLSLPGAVLTPVHLTHRTLEGAIDLAAFHHRLGVIPADVNAWIVLANPFRFDVQEAISTLGMAYPTVPVIGGLASPDAGSRQTALLINGGAILDGAVALGIGGPYEVLPVVSHGCEPIGLPWTITGVEGDWIESIGGRPALQVLDDTLRDTPNDLLERTRRNLLVGLAMNEYRSDFRRGDFLVRAIAGIDQPTGAIAIGARARSGQTVQFQLRDAASADLDLSDRLDALRQRMTGSTPVALLAFAGQERGASLFGSESHDALAIQRKFPGVATAGLYTAGEIGPAGNGSATNVLSLTLAMIVRLHETDERGNRRYD
jgi:small ligand-binding sensory domain FIST